MRLIYYKNLDGVRAIAALMIMTFHFFQNIGTTYRVPGYLLKAAVFWANRR